MKLRQAITFMIMPFYIDNGEFGQGTKVLPDKSTRWQPADMKVDIGAFYPHVQQFLQASVNSGVSNGKPLRESDFRIYSLRDSDDVKKHIIRHQVVMRLSSGDHAAKVRFAFMQKDMTLFSPKLVISPMAAVGLLMLPIQPLDDLTDRELVRMNYLLHKISRLPCPLRLCTTSHVYQLPRSRNKGHGSEIKLAETLGLPKPKGEEQVVFTFPQVVEALMKNIDYHSFNTDMLHTFTYVQVPTAEWQSTEHTRREQGNTENTTLYNFARLVMCINEQYRLSSDQVNQMIVRSFANVYMGSSASGGGIMTIADDDSPAVMQQFLTDSLQPRYLWIYLLVVMQQHTLINMTRWLSTIPTDTHSGQRSLKQMRQTLRQMSELNVSTRFSCISDYTQHNAFYRHCSDNLGISTLYGEVEQKMATITDILEQLSDSMKETLQVVFTIILALLTVFSATNDGLDVLEKWLSHGWAYRVTAILFLLTMAGIFGWLAMRFRRVFSSK